MQLNIKKSINNANIKNLLEQKKARQVSALYSSMIFGILLGIGISVINTRLLGPKQFGDLKFLQNLFSFIITFLTLGIFVSGSRILAQRKNEKIKHQLIGSLLILASIISIVFIGGLFIFSFFEEQIFQNELSRVIKIFSPLLFVFPFELCLENIMQGDNKIYELSIFRLGPRMLYLSAAILFNYFTPLSLTSALAIQFVASTMIILIMIIAFKPKFFNLKKNISIIWQENKTYGLQVYFGILAGVTSAKLAGISIGYFIDNTNVGFFLLALTISMPLTMLPNAVGTTFFKDFANRNYIPKNVSIFTLIVSIISLVIFIIFIKKVILLLYSPAYEAVVPLVYIVSIGCVFHGIGDYINRFLGAHGKGRELRNGAFAVGISNILGYTILVYMFGTKGAAVTKMASGLIYCFMMYFFYVKFRKNLALAKETGK
ncbi:MAG: oligosaccharide flippase family protein [Candidatus Helarchaeota archaeon]